MKGFKFGLERVLRYKDLIVGQREAELREAAEKHIPPEAGKAGGIDGTAKEEIFAGRLEPLSLSTAVPPFSSVTDYRAEETVGTGFKKVREIRGRLWRPTGTSGFGSSRKGISWSMDVNGKDRKNR